MGHQVFSSGKAPDLSQNKNGRHNAGHSGIQNFIIIGLILPVLYKTGQ